MVIDDDDKSRALPQDAGHSLAAVIESLLGKLSSPGDLPTETKQHPLELS